MASETLLNEAGNAPEHAVGMPQLDFATYPNQWFWLVVTLIVLYVVISRIALPRIASVLAERQGAIARDIERAEALKRQAVDAEDAYNKALADARTEAAHIVAEAKAEIQKDVDLATEKAEAEIAAKTAESEARILDIRKGAQKSVEAVAKATAGEIVKAIMPGAADKKAVDAAVSAKLKG